jgi:hypothetical protein
LPKKKLFFKKEGANRNSIFEGKNILFQKKKETSIQLSIDLIK